MANTEQPNGNRRPMGFDEFRRLHRDRLYRAVTSVTREPDTAVEAVDEAMARAAERWDVVVDHTVPAGWVFRSALRRGRPLLRGRRRSHTPHKDGANIDPQMSAALVDLPYRLRAVIVARYYLEWSVEQTADALRLPVRTVEKRLGNALRRVERSLDDQS